jgi:ABC-2 type transport system permease protein
VDRVDTEARAHASGSRDWGRALNTPSALKASLSPVATLDDVFTHHTGRSPLSGESTKMPPECVAPRTDWNRGAQVARFFGQVAAVAEADVRKLRHDPLALLTRMIQPMLWLLIFGEVFARSHAIPTGSIGYLEFNAPGILAQSVLFVDILYGVSVIWERDLGILHKYLVFREC